VNKLKKVKYIYKNNKCVGEIWDEPCRPLDEYIIAGVTGLSIIGLILCWVNLSKQR